MGIPRFRQVRSKGVYTEIHQFQCLACREFFCGPSSFERSLKFCPMCGTRVEFIQTRPTDIPRWAFDRWGVNLPTYVSNRIYYYPYTTKPDWNLMERCCRGGNWSPWCILDEFNEMSAREMHEAIVSWRKFNVNGFPDKDCQYRVEIAKKA